MQERESDAWRILAECLNTDPDRFMPVVVMIKLRQDSKEAAIAIETCGRCAVRQSCLDFAVTHGHDGMIWGGLVPKEIDKLRARKKTA